jgi:hypothetical protein
MSITSGFYDSLNGDRRYNAAELSAIFNGIINDGVLANVGEAFAVKAGDGNTVSVGIGRAWFNSTWIYNDASLSVVVPDSHLSGATNNPNVIDLLVLEVDRSESVRAATVKFVGGKTYGQYFTAAEAIDLAEREYVGSFNSSSVDVKRYPLAAIRRKGRSTDPLTQAQITNRVGTSNCPYVTGILQVQSIDNIVAQWESEFDTWFTDIRSVAELDGDVATALAGRIGNLENGTTPAGNASKLGGQAPSYYAKATDVSNIVSGATSVGKAADANKLGGSAASDYAKKADLKAENITAGYFPGVMRASPTAVANVGDSMIRNIYAGTSDMTAGSTTLASGAIYVMYE